MYWFALPGAPRRVRAKDAADGLAGRFPVEDPVHPAVDRPSDVQSSAGYMLTVSVVVLALPYWRRGLDRRTAVEPLRRSLPGFLLL